MSIKPVKENEILIAKGMLDGDRKSYVDFVEKFSPYIYRECLKYSNDSDEADDHLNEILIRIVIFIGRFDPEKGSMYTWVAAVTRNYLKNCYQKKMEEPEFICYEKDALDLYAHKTSVYRNSGARDEEEEDDDEPDLIKLRRALAGMSKRDRRILFYRADGFSYENIGEFLDIKSGTAMTAYSRAVRRIKEMFN